MAEDAKTKRLIICVDGSEFDSKGTSGNGNASNIFRLKSLIPGGLVYDSSGRTVYQLVRYYQAAEDNVVSKLKGRGAVSNSEKQIKDILKEICETLKNIHDEVFFYGFGHGAFIVRAVAGLLHHMRVPKQSTMNAFDEIYQNALDFYKARREDDSLNGPRIVEYLKNNTTVAPRIQFVGVFDTIHYNDKHVHDLSLVPSILNMRHALALNESRSSLAPEIIETPPVAAMDGRTFIQAWFMGTQLDLGGGAHNDGLSLYPLQWMILESIKAGLTIEPPKPSPEVEGSNSENPLALAFPQYMGDVPKYDGTEKIEWNVDHTNGIRVSMYDIGTVHGQDNIDKNHTHSIRINQTSTLYNSHRKVFGSDDRVLGWSEAPFGTIVHPSVFCILDRIPRVYEQYQFRDLKKKLSDYRSVCLKVSDEVLPPWMEGMELQASGVKAFRILVCGSTGVGKSTLINKVFGVEMTEESLTYTQGDHDINQAFESPNHPGLLVHDSRGWQAGSDKELDLIAKFLRHRAFQKDPAQALHVIWFCVDADVSRIEEADKRTFETIAQFSHHVPVFVIGTKKDKLIAIHKIKLLEKYMMDGGNYVEANKRATEEADQMAEEQFLSLRQELSKIKHYKADGYCCLSKDDSVGIRRLLTQTLALITDDQVRLFAVAAQVVDVNQKIEAAITECMRLATHAVRTAMVPLPFSSAIGTPTVARILVEHVLQCFGFPKARPEAIEDIMSRVVLGNMRSFMVVTFAQFMTVGLLTAGLIVGTMGAGGVLGLGVCVLAAPPTARMMFKCACDMILILERSFRYKGRYVSVKQIEDAAKYYTTTKITTFAGNEKRLQDHVHDEVDRLIPLSKISTGLRFSKLRAGLEDIIFQNRFEQDGPRSDSMSPISPTVPGMSEMQGHEIVELDASEKDKVIELDAGDVRPIVAELAGDSDTVSPLQKESLGFNRNSTVSSRTHTSGASTMLSSQRSTTSQTIMELEGDLGTESAELLERRKTENSSKSFLSGRKWSMKSFGLKKSKSNV